MKNVIFIEPKARENKKKSLLPMVMKVFIRGTIILIVAILIYHYRDSLPRDLISEVFTDVHHYVEMVVNSLQVYIKLNL